MIARTALSILAVLALEVRPESTTKSDLARTFLADSLNVTQADIGRIDAGEVYSRTLAVKHSREVATLGIVRIRTTPAVYLERLADIVSFKRDAAILQIGAFGDPPQLHDLADLTLEEADVRRLRECRVGDCSVQLSADAIERFRRDVDWQAADVQQRANQLMRLVLVEYVRRYLKDGPLAAMEYADRPARLNLGHEFAALVAADTVMWSHFPDLRRHLTEYPVLTADGTRDRIYWSKERVNARPVISVTHLSIERVGGESAVEYAIASKHIYGMHYFDASLGLTLLLTDRSTPSGTYVVYLNRSRIDLFDGLFGAIVRNAVRGKARTLVADQLGRLRRTLDAELAR